MVEIWVIVVRARAEYWIEYRVQSTVRCENRAKVQIGRRPVQRWKSRGREEYGGRKTVRCENRAKVQIGRRPVQRCKSEAGKITECGVQSTDLGGMR